jgi:hypothetical protein
VNSLRDSAGASQSLSRTELEEKIADLNVLYDANEEYIKTLERRNKDQWDAIQNLEGQLREMGIPFQPFNINY